MPGPGLASLDRVTAPRRDAAAVGVAPSAVATSVGVAAWTAGTALLAAVICGLLGLVGPLPRAAAAPGPARAPLRVTVTSLAPAVLPPVGGRLTLTGTVTNTSAGTWSALNVYLFTSTEPMTTRGELRRAAASEPTAEVGDRLTDPRLFVRIRDLAPHQRTTYRLSVPRRDLQISGAAGVYWVGVHVLGAGPDGSRDLVADGRARTFMPLHTGNEAPVPLALVMPIRQPVHRGAAGRLLASRRWERRLSTHGRLDRLLGLGETASEPMTWLVDPAVLDAVRSVASGAPLLGPDAIAPTEEPSPAETSGGPLSESPSEPAASGTPAPSSSAPSASSEPSTTGPSTTGPTTTGPTTTGPTTTGPTTTGPTTTGPSPTEPSSTVAPGPSGAARTAEAWLETFLRQAERQPVLAVPYGDLDVAAVLSHAPLGLYPHAAQLSERALTGLGVTSQPVVAPASGYLPPRAVRRAGPAALVLLHDLAYPTESGRVLTGAGQPPVVLADTDAAAGGPGPNPRRSALAMRQRILSEAALYAGSAASGQPLVVSLPPYWDPGPDWKRASFFAGLDVPWLRLVDLPSLVLARTGILPRVPSRGQSRSVTDVPAPVYPRAERRHEVPAVNLRASARLLQTGEVYANLLTENDTVDDDLAELGMLGSGLGARDRPRRARAQVDSTDSLVRGRMSLVRIEGPPFVMLSSDQGPIQVSLVNGLDEPVRVGVQARALGSDITITRPDPVTLGPGQRTAIRLRSKSSDIGVHSVTLLATDSAGDPLGSSVRLTVRTSQVGMVIWVVMAAGATILFLTIAVRLVRRLLHRRTSRGRVGAAGR